MKKIVRLTESDLVRLVKRVLMEQPMPTPNDIPQIPGLSPKLVECLMKAGLEISVENGEELKICQQAITNPTMLFTCAAKILTITTDPNVINKAQSCVTSPK